MTNVLLTVTVVAAACWAAWVLAPISGRGDDERGKR